VGLRLSCLCQSVLWLWEGSRTKTTQRHSSQEWDRKEASLAPSSVGWETMAHRHLHQRRVSVGTDERRQQREWDIDCHRCREDADHRRTSNRCSPWEWHKTSLAPFPSESSGRRSRASHHHRAGRGGNDRTHLQLSGEPLIGEMIDVQDSHSLIGSAPEEGGGDVVFDRLLASLVLLALLGQGDEAHQSLRLQREIFTEELHLESCRGLSLKRLHESVLCSHIDSAHLEFKEEQARVLEGDLHHPRVIVSRQLH
jgi:hypothetical protein